MPSSSGDYTFEARRRGEAVVIRGTVLAPPGSEPYLIAAYDSRPTSRTFRLAFRNNSATVPFEPHALEHVEPSVPRSVDMLKILLPNEETFTIKRHSRQDPK